MALNIFPNPAIETFPIHESELMMGQEYVIELITVQGSPILKLLQVLQKTLLMLVNLSPVCML
ncbi:hypothetical protein GCM10009117_05600 [Gangjinia marincola]|uniref:Uncharacterized protein n=1 Tax=Gangjinia marincola TaxID=578463 RepID=A0ABP3XQ90_9FLAO